MSKKLLVSIISILACLTSFAQGKVCLEKGTKVSVKVVSQMTSQRVCSPNVVMAADIYDVDGETLIIAKGTPVQVQVKFLKATLFGDAGRIEITPISTTSVNGRDIAFDEVPVIFFGNDAVLMSRKKAFVAENTAFSAIIANNYCFKMTNNEE